jgi:hypothetical protein
MIVLLGGISNCILWLFEALCFSPVTQPLDGIYVILLLSCGLSVIPVFLSLTLIGLVEKTNGYKFIWWIHAIPLVIFMALLIYWKSYFGLISLSLYYVLGAYSYWKLIHKPRLLSNQ